MRAGGMQPVAFAVCAPRVYGTTRSSRNSQCRLAKRETVCQSSVRSDGGGEGGGGEGGGGGGGVQGIDNNNSDNSGSAAGVARVRVLRARLRDAVCSERYSEAAVLRDTLREAVRNLSDTEAVLEANGTFYDAVSAADISQMSDIWLQSSTVSCMHPLQDLVVGFDAVLSSWRSVFLLGKPAALQVNVKSVIVKMNMAWVVAEQKVQSVRSRELIGGPRIATNVFQKRQGEWRVTHHHASPVILLEGEPNAREQQQPQ